jgi:hypothetical protein
MFSADERNERWLKVSIGLGRFEQHMMPLVQQLGRLDARLIQADEIWPDRFLQEKLSYDDTQLFMNTLRYPTCGSWGRMNSFAPSAIA